MQLLNESEKQIWLVWFFRGLIVLVFLTLFARTFDLQIIRGEHFKSLSEGNRVRTVPIFARRGNILARGGEILADSVEVKKKIVFSSETGYEKMDAANSDDASALISEWERKYVPDGKFAHVIGYIGEINSDEVGRVEAKCIDKGAVGPSELIGRGGLEQQYDCELRGEKGEELIEVDAFSKMVRILGRKNPVRGTDLQTTLDFGLQTLASDLLKDKKGAIVITGKNGGLLALVSSPTYDSNLFVSGNKNHKIGAILRDQNLPMLNRAISGKYHPGSIYKPLVAIAALEEGKIDENYLYEDVGRVVINSLYGSFSFSNWYYTQYGSTEGNINVVKALARSTDTFFYNVGELTGVDALVRWSHNFGLHEKTGVDLPGETSGLVPDPQWKERTTSERWFLGNTYNMAIGQGDLALTPIGIHTAISALANNGKICRPHLVDSAAVDPCHDLPIKKENIDIVKKGMLSACTSGGTAYSFFDFGGKRGIEVACKTGTAQNVNMNPHSWFTAFAPAENAEIVVTVLVEEGGEGSKVAGPIAREIFNYWSDNGSFD